MSMLSTTQPNEEPAEGYQRLSSSLLSTTFVNQELRTSGRPNDVAVGRLRRRVLGGLEMTRSDAGDTAFGLCRSAEVIRSCPHDEVFLGVLLASRISLEVDYSVEQILAGDMVLMDIRKPYLIEIAGGVEALWIRIPRARVRSRMLVLDDCTGRRVGGDRGIAHVASQAILASFDAASTITGAQAPLLADSLLDLVCYALAGRKEGAGSSTTLQSLITLRRLQEYISANLTDETMTPTSVALANGISLRRLNELFTQNGGSVAAWIIERRLEHGRRMLLAPRPYKAPISAIAYASGFKNVSHFNRAFKARYGIRPSDCRTAGGEVGSGCNPI
jgi:AraC family transcriptional activator of tynA and feaB